MRETTLISERVVFINSTTSFQAAYKIALHISNIIGTRCSLKTFSFVAILLTREMKEKRGNGPAAWAEGS